MASEADEMIEMLLDSADAFLADQHQLGRLRIGEHPAETVVEPSIWRQMADLGWLGLALPEAMGGAGLPMRYSAVLCERLGRSLLPEPLIASALMPGALLAACPASEARDALAAELAAGDAPLTIAWQEATDQIAPGPIATTLSESGLSGRKLFVPASLPDARRVVLCEQGGEAVLVVVASSAAGSTSRPYRMGDGSRMLEIGFERTPVTGPSLARGQRALDAVARALEVGTIALAAQLAGLAEGALALWLEYLKTRSQFGKPIGAFQSLQHRAVDLYLLVELAKASWRHAAALHERLPGDPASVAAISAAKIASIKAARRTSEAGIQFFGAMGFTEEADIGLYLRSTLHWGSWLGSETAHRRRFLANRRLEAAA